MKVNLLMLAALLAVCAQGALEVKNVKLSQDWPWSNKVKLTYDLSGLEAGELAEVVVTATSGGKPIEMYAPGLTGDIYSLDANDSYTISIDPVKAFGKGIEFVPDVRMSVTARAATSASTNVLYKIFDLSDNTVADVTRGALLNGEWGSVETDFGAIGPGYTTTLDDVVIWTGVTNDIAYKTSKLVVRKIPAGAFKGYAPGGAIPEANNMTWSFDYWIGVFEVTQAQRAKIGTGSYDVKSKILGDAIPDQFVQNYYLYNANGKTRNATTSGATKGFFPKLRDKFKVEGVCPYDFELPTQVQWMRAMRAGADSYYYDGIGKTSKEVTDEQFYALGNTKDNGGWVVHDDGSVTTNIMEVGCFRPNAYGLYDMIGNIREHVRETRDGDLSDTQWTEGGENIMGSWTNGTWGKSYGGSFSETSWGLSEIQLNTGSGKSLNAGFRVCMQSMEDGIALITPKTE